MKMLKKGEKGFTLIELLIVVAILGVLAAVVIPNVGRFIGRGEEEAAETELANVQSAVVAMMVDNSITSLDDAVSSWTDNMSSFPSPNAADNLDHVLYGFGNNSSINYVVQQMTSQRYTVDSQGTVTQEP